MRICVDTSHDTTRAGGKAIRVSDGDIDAFLCWGHIPTIRALVGSVPEQFEKSQYVCDLEVHNDGIIAFHKERAFKTEAKARAWFRYVAWCLARLQPRDFFRCRELEWRLS